MSLWMKTPIGFLVMIKKEKEFLFATLVFLSAPIFPKIFSGSPFEVTSDFNTDIFLFQMSDVCHLSRLSYANISRILFAPLKKKVGKTLNCWNCRSYKKPVIRCHLKHDQTTYVVTGNSYSKKISFYDCFNGYFIITLWSWIATERNEKSKNKSVN